MIRLLYLLTSMLLLLMPLTDRKEKWSMGGVDWHGYIFVFCMVAYIPMMVATLFYLVGSIIIFFQKNNVWIGISYLATAATGWTALHVFNCWVINEIF